MASAPDKGQAGPDPPITVKRLNELVKARDNDAPVPILTQRADMRVRRELRDLATKGCDAQIGALARCFEGRVFTVIWHCRKLSKAVDACMKTYTLDETLKDEMRRRHGARFPRAVMGYRESPNAASKTKPSTEGVAQASTAT